MSKPRLLDRVRNAIRVRQYSLATEKTYLGRIRKFILFHGKRYPADLAKAEIEAFLSYLAVERQVSPSMQNQALQALLFMYRFVLEIELPWLDDVVRAKPKRRVPVVLSSSMVHLAPVRRWISEQVSAQQPVPDLPAKPPGLAHGQPEPAFGAVRAHFHNRFQFRHQVGDGFAAELVEFGRDAFELAHQVG